jgi:uncharacterized protein YkwD
MRSLKTINPRQSGQRETQRVLSMDDSMFSGASIRTSRASSTNVQASSVNKLVNGVFRLVNKKRAAKGLQPVSLNSKLQQAAQAHSQDMAVNDFFSHTGSNGSSMGDRLRQVNYSYSYAAENIAAGSSTARGVMKQWMKSPGHRANILSKNVTEIGIGYYYQANDGGNAPWGHYWTQNFGRPFS